jgi:predicted negative regulator of RcsB-dependent stress response
VSYETEEQRVEAIRKWWSENGTSIIAGLVLGLALLFGWRYWVDHREGQREEASALFTQLQQAASSGNAGRVDEVTTTLQQDYASTPYSGQASLLNAQLLAKSGKLDRAEEVLSWASLNANEQVIRDLAHLNLARLYVAQGKIDQALGELPQVEASAYQSQVEEIRGDALRASGDIEAAREAYDRAILTSGGSVPAYLQMKRDDLGNPES